MIILITFVPVNHPTPKRGSSIYKNSRPCLDEFEILYKYTAFS